MDITFFILLTIISFLCLFYGWDKDGFNLHFILISLLLFSILAFVSLDVTWSYPVVSNSTVETYVITQRDTTLAMFFALMSSLAGVMAIGKVAILAEEFLDYSFGPLMTKIKSLFKKQVR